MMLSVAPQSFLLTTCGDKEIGKGTLKQVKIISESPEGRNGNTTIEGLVPCKIIFCRITAKLLRI